MKEFLLEVLQNVNWSETLTNFINVCLYLAVPLILEFVTGVLRSTASYFEAKREDSWAMRLAADVATTMAAQWQIEAKDIREKWEAGKLSLAEWEKEKQDLKNGFKEKMLLKLKQYPAEYAKKFETEIEDYMEAWLAKNKQIESLLKILKQQKTIKDPEILAQIKEQIDAKIKEIHLR